MVYCIKNSMLKLCLLYVVLWEKNDSIIMCNTFTHHLRCNLSVYVQIKKKSILVFPTDQEILQL